MGFTVTHVETPESLFQAVIVLRVCRALLHDEEEFDEARTKNFFDFSLGYILHGFMFSQR
ncbi:MAG: hypothetical protein GY854_08240 [Deltaproteobacteria bacterium]|nr:hypothetical protein [Deltaproteobacteria bacterium]